jgi:hypothetical protein
VTNELGLLLLTVLVALVFTGALLFGALLFTGALLEVAVGCFVSFWLFARKGMVA